MIPRFRPLLKWHYFLYFIINKKFISYNNFEDCLSKKSNFKFVSTFVYGRVSLWVFLKSLKIEKKEIICPNYTCMVVANAVESSGNSCVLVDIDKETLQFDEELLLKSISKNTYGIVFTDLFGLGINLDLIKKVKQEWPNLILFLDLTHSFNLNLSNEIISKVDVAFCGFGLSKPISSGFGGALLTNNEAFYQTIEYYKKVNFEKNKLRNFNMFFYLLCSYVAFLPGFYFITHFLEKNRFLDHFTVLFSHEKIEMPQDFLNNMSFVENRFGLYSAIDFLDNLNSILENKKKLIEILKKQNYLLLQEKHQTTFYLNILVDKRDDFLNYFLSQGIELGVLYDYSISKLFPYRNHKIFSNTNNSEYISEHIVNLPLNISGAELKKVIRVLNHYHLQKVIEKDE